MTEEIHREKCTRSMSDKELFTGQISYSHVHTDLTGFVCPKCGWCMPKMSVTSYDKTVSNKLTEECNGEVKQ
jgi:hypothetical protein